MVKKTIKCVGLVLLLVIIGYNSIYFKKLDAVKASSSAQQFDATVYAQSFWAKLQPKINTAIEMNQLLPLLKNNPDSTFKACSHALGIGNVRYILVKGEGLVKAIGDDEVAVSLQPENSKTIKIATEYIFGNAVRDASGLMDVSEFTNTMDFNNVSVAINKLIRTTVLPNFKQTVKTGDTIQFVGAIELNTKHLNLENIGVIPVRLIIIKP